MAPKDNKLTQPKASSASLPQGHGETVVKANALVEAGHRLSLAEQRVVLAAITQIRRDEVPDSRTWYSVTAGGLADVAGLEASDAYDCLEAAVKRLYERSITITEKPNGEAGQPDPAGTDVLQCRWVQAARYIRTEGRVELMFSEPVTPYLAQLKSHFTKYQLKNVAPMRSRFGPRLYELLAQWRQAGEREVSIDWLQEVWETAYQRVYEFKRKAINPAVQDVNEYSDIFVEVGYRKTGRSVTHVQFRFWPKRTSHANKVANEPESATSKRLSDEYVRRHAKPGETWEDATRRLRRDSKRQRKAESATVTADGHRAEGFTSPGEALERMKETVNDRNGG